MTFEVDSRIHSSSIFLGDWPLSSVYFKKDANFPWTILVPRENKISEIYQLGPDKSQLLMTEINILSTIINDFFHPDKINIAALGNIVSQLHIHVVARFKKDKAWPHSIWQPDLEPGSYEKEVLDCYIEELSAQIKASYVLF